MAKKRIFILVLICLASLVGWRLIDVQLVRGAFYLRMAEENRIFTLMAPAARGNIYDRYQDLLAYTEKQYLQVSNTQVLYPQTTPLTRADALPQLATASTQVEHEYVRRYKFKDATAHLIGYLGYPNENDLRKNSNLKANSLIGKGGLEAYFETLLAGVAGMQKYEINAKGQKQRLIQQSTATDGQALHTTIDPYLSQVAYILLANKKGAIVISDAQTGEILTAVSSPSFDPNLLVPDPLVTATARSAAVRELLANENKPFFNRATAGEYPPGSVFKIATSLAGLENQKINTNTTVIDEGSIKVGEYEYGNWYFRQHGRVEGEIGLVRSIARSNDIFFYKAAEWMGPDLLAKMAKLLGFGRKPQLQIPELTAGVVPSPAWKEQIKQQMWFLGDTYHFGIGQGDLLVSPLQVQQLTQIVGHQGTYCTPTLVSRADQPGQCYELGVSSNSIEIVLEGMIGACSANGTAYPFFDRNSQLAQAGQNVYEQIANGVVACKTGTAEFGGQDERGYRNTHGWFTMLVSPQLRAVEIVEQASTSEKISQLWDVNSIPSYRQWREKLQINSLPEKLVITVLVESDDAQKYREGSRDAAPLAKAIVDWIETGELLQVNTDSLPTMGE